QQDQTMPRRANNFRLQGSDLRAQIDTSVRLLCNPRLNQVQLGDRLGGGHAGFEPPDRGEIEFANQILFVELWPVQRRYELRASGEAIYTSGKAERFRQNAHDRVRSSVEHDGTPYTVV